MKTIRWIAIAVSLAALIASAPAQAQHRGHFRGGLHFGIGIGVPFYAYPPSYYYPPPYYYPRYYYPPVALAPPSPPVYVERQDQAQSDAGHNDWYYCPESKTYYPYVKQCAGEWQRVSPHPLAK